MDDRDLLQAYARDRSEAAFAELVRRHLAWVYSVALRHTGDQALAKDVAQSVFVLLAQKAGSLHSGVVLGGWLFRTTRFVGNRALRAERRRKSREETAASMIQSTPDENDAVWKQLEPHLDEAVASLSESDRQAILLRFYEKKPLLEVGRHLGLSEEAAKKRVSRAIQKMRDFLVHRGVTAGTTLLAGLLAEQSVQAIPTGLTASVLNSAAAAISSSGVFPQLAQETLNAWRWTRFKIAGGIAVSLCGLVWFCFVTAPHSQPFANSSGTDGARAEGELPAETVAVSPAAQTNLSAETRARSMRFRVVENGSDEPVPGASLAVNTVSAEGWKQRFDLSTDENGSADIPVPPDAGRLDVGVMSSGWVARFATWRIDTDPEFPAEYTMRVDAVTNFMGGWLMNETGQPVANAAVEVEFGGSDMAQEENPRERLGFVGAVPVTTSDQNGWWSCAVVKPNARRLPVLRARHSDFAPAEIFSGSWGNPDEAQSQSMELLWNGRLVTTMKPGVTLIGRILTEDGQPIGGAQIEHGPSSFQPIRTESDSLGWFTLPGLPPGTFDFFVTAPGFAQEYFQVSLKEGEERFEARLKPGGILRLRLVDEESNPVVNGTVAWTGPGGMYMPGMNWMGRSGLDGRIEWTSAPTDRTLNICASKDREFAMRHTVVKADGKEHVIQLRRIFVVTGRVTDARSGELIRKEIKAFPGYGEGENGWFRGSTWRSTYGTYRICSSEGRFPYRFRVEAEGYSPFVSEWLDPNSHSIVDVSLQPADPLKAVRGTVWRTDGQPAAGAEVALLSPEHGALLGKARFADRAVADRLIVNADAAGKFAFPEEPNAAFVVAVCSNGFARMLVRDIESEMEIRLEPWGSVAGIIAPSVRNRPVDGVMIGDLLSLGSLGVLRLDPQEFHAKPADDGGFAFEFLPPGLLCVRLNSGVSEDHKVPPYHHPTWIQVAAGQTGQVEITETGYKVKGRLVLARSEGDLFKQPAYAILASDSPSGSATAESLNSKQWDGPFFDSGRLIIEPNGRFKSRNPIKPGTYRLRGKIDDVHLDQPVEVTPPLEIGFANLLNTFDPVAPPVIDLGDIIVFKEEDGAPKQR